jgi:pre-mRNA-splicing factor CWC22
VGELLVKRLIMRFRKAFKRNDKAVCLSSTVFIAHLVNNQVVHEMLAAQILLLLLQKPTDDSVEIAVGLMREVGLFLEEMKPTMAHLLFDRFRDILHEADIDRRTQYMIEVLFQVRKDKYKDNPVIKEELDLVEEDDQITHQIGLDDEINTQDTLNIFKFDPDWQANEDEYKKLKADILGEGSDDEDDEDESGSESEEEDVEQKAVEIKDQSNADLVNLRRTIYLTIQSSADPEEAAHKLMKLRLPPGQETELVSMIIETCAQEKVYLKFMGLLGERFARLNRMWTDLFEESFMKYYSTIHRYETNKLRKIARFFGHLLSSDSIGWHVFSAIHLNEEETTSASRIFIQILFEDLQENMGTAKLKTRLGEDMLQPSLQGIFPYDNPRNTRFAINYFTAIKMGFLTDEMRTFLANVPKPALPAPPADSDTESVSSYSSYTGSSYSSRSRSRTPPRKAIDRGRSISRTPPRKTRDSRSYSRSRSYTRSVSTGRSVSPPPRRQARDISRSRSPSRRSYSRSRSPLPNRGRPRTRSRSYSRSLSRSRSPVAAAAGPGPSKRRRADSYSVSRSPPPPPTRRQRRYSRSPSRSRSRTRSLSGSRSPVPPARGGGGAGQDRYCPRDVSPPPAGAAAGPSGSGPGARGRGRGYSYSRSRSPPPAPAERRGVGGGRGGGYGNGYRDRDDRNWRGGRRYSRSRSRSRSPSRSPLPPAAAGSALVAGRGRGDSRSPSPVRSAAGGGKRRRYDSSSRSRSPRGSAKRGRVNG